MTDSDIRQSAEEIASRMRSQASPKEIMEFKILYKSEGKEPIEKEAEKRIDNDIDNREEVISEVVDIIAKGLEKL